MNDTGRRPQVVIVCGGRGTRLAPSIGDLPKILTPLDDRSLLAHLLDDLATLGDAEVLLLAGHGGEQVAAEADRLAPPGLEVTTHVETRPRGTAGALLEVEDRLHERFLFACGDVVTSLDWRRLWQAADRRGGLATLLVHRSSHPEDSDLVVLDDADRAFAWSRRDDPRRSGSGGLPGALGNAGVAVLHRDLLQRVPRDRSSDIFRDIMPPLVEARAPVFGYRTPEYVRDMGTPPRLDAVRQDLEMGRVHPKADLVLLDRDGVLIEDVDGLTRPEQIRLLPGTGEALRRFAAAGVATAVVTNQSIVARGLASVDDLDRIHARLRQLLAAEGAQVGDILYCPHHHETHHGEGIDALRGPCSCRKPSAELLHRAIAAADVPAWRAIMIGDRTSDVQAAHNAGLSALGVDTGMGLGDDRCPARPTFRFADLEAASRWLCPPATQRRRV